MSFGGDVSMVWLELGVFRREDEAGAGEGEQGGRSVYESTRCKHRKPPDPWVGFQDPPRFS